MASTSPAAAAFVYVGVAPEFEFQYATWAL
jgi:hypothetical protein